MFQAESGKVNDVAVALNHQCISYELGCVMFVLYEFGMFFVKTLALRSDIENLPMGTVLRLHYC